MQLSAITLPVFRKRRKLDSHQVRVVVSAIVRCFSNSDHLTCTFTYRPSPEPRTQAAPPVNSQKSYKPAGRTEYSGPGGDTSRYFTDSIYGRIY